MKGKFWNGLGKATILVRLEGPNGTWYPKDGLNLVSSCITGLERGHGGPSSGSQPRNWEFKGKSLSEV